MFLSQLDIHCWPFGDRFLIVCSWNVASNLGISAVYFVEIFLVISYRQLPGGREKVRKEAHFRGLAY